MNERWQLEDAQAHFPELVQKSKDEGPQIVTLDDQDAAVIVSIEEYRRLTRPKEGSLADFFLNSPLAGLDIDFEQDRSRDTGRDIDL